MTTPSLYCTTTTFVTAWDTPRSESFLFTHLIDENEAWRSNVEDHKVVRGNPSQCSLPQINIIYNTQNISKIYGMTPNYFSTRISTVPLKSFVVNQCKQVTNLHAVANIPLLLQVTSFLALPLTCTKMNLLPLHEHRIVFRSIMVLSARASHSLTWIAICPIFISLKNPYMIFPYVWCVLISKLQGSRAPGSSWRVD
jgi:hypothetical protein